MARCPQPELIWQGRIHLGDEPGVFADSAYSGLSAELPITTERSDPNDVTATSFKLQFVTSHLQTFAGYPGHLVEVVRYLPDPASPYHSIEQVVASDRFTTSDANTKDITVSVGQEVGPFRFSVRLRCDTTVSPGLYNDFVWRRLTLLADGFSFFASLGFPN